MNYVVAGQFICRRAGGACIAISHSVRRRAHMRDHMDINMFC